MLIIGIEVLGSLSGWLRSACLHDWRGRRGRHEGIGYALRLLQAGVPVELHQWPGTFHSSFAVLAADVSQRQIAELFATLRRALA